MSIFQMLVQKIDDNTHDNGLNPKITAMRRILHNAICRINTAGN